MEKSSDGCLCRTCKLYGCEGCPRANAEEEVMRIKQSASVEKIFQIIKNSHFISTEGDTDSTYPTRKEKEDMLEKDCFRSLAIAIHKLFNA